MVTFSIFFTSYHICVFKCSDYKYIQDPTMPQCTVVQLPPLKVLFRLVVFHPSWPGLPELCQGLGGGGGDLPYI